MLSCHIVARKENGQKSLFFARRKILVSLESGVVVAEDLEDLQSVTGGFVDGMEKLNCFFIFVCPAHVSESLLTFIDRLISKEEPSLQLELSLFGAAGLLDPEVSPEENAAIAELNKLLA